MRRYIFIFGIIGMVISIALLFQPSLEARYLTFIVPPIIGGLTAFFQRSRGIVTSRIRAILDGAAAGIIATLITNALLTWTIGVLMSTSCNGSACSEEPLTTSRVLLSLTFYGIYTLVSFVLGLIGGLLGTIVVRRGTGSPTISTLT